MSTLFRPFVYRKVCTTGGRVLPKLCQDECTALHSEEILYSNQEAHIAVARGDSGVFGSASALDSIDRMDGV